MARVLLALLIFLTPLATRAADDGRVSFLEQEVRELKRQVMTLTRRLDYATTRPDRLAEPDSPRAAGVAPTPTEWVDAGKWRKLRAGMSELEVVSLLGPPTSMREVEGARVLFYALEIGTDGFLGGSVRLKDRAVVAIQAPTLQ